MKRNVSSYHFENDCHFFHIAPKPSRKTRGELARNVNADYYGYRDEDDGVIVPLEQEEEKEGMLYHVLAYILDSFLL